MITYPSALPVTEIELIITDIRSSSVMSDRAAFSNALWVLMGYALMSTFGTPNAPIPAPVPSKILQAMPPCDDDQAANELEKIVISHKSSMSQGLNIPWGMLIRWGFNVLVTLL